MKEVERFKPVTFPPETCVGCKNRLTDICMEACAPYGDLRYFEPKRISIHDLPEFPDGDEWKKVDNGKKMLLVKQHIDTIEETLRKVIKETGLEVNDGRDFRAIVYGIRGRGVPAAVEGTSLRDDSPEGNSGDQGERAEVSGEREGSDGMAPETKGQ